jgi:hypothetical protein
MTDPRSRKEELRIDGQEIVGKVKGAFKGRVQTEEIKVQGDQLLAKVKELVRAGNVRRIILKNAQGITVLEIPLTLGVVGALVLPVWAAIGAIAALAVDYTIVVEKIEED